MIETVEFQKNEESNQLTHMFGNTVQIYQIQIIESEFIKQTNKQIHQNLDQSVLILSSEHSKF